MSAFGLARALAEEAPAHIEEAPEREAYGTEYDGVTVDDIEDVASEPVEAFSEAMEAPAEEVAMELGGEAAALPMEESSVELADAAVEALPENPVFEIGSRKVFKLNALAAACGITGTVENVGTTNDDDTLKFVVFTDEAGDLAIEFPHSFDALELAFFTEDGIQTVTLVNAVIPEAENFVEEEAPVEEATPVEDAILVEEVPAEEAPLAEAAAPTEEAAPVEEEAAAEEVLAEEASAEEETPVEEAVTEEAPAEKETAEEAPVEEEAVAEEASEPVMMLTEDGAVEVAEKAMDAEEAEEAQEETEADPEAEAIAQAEERRELLAGMIDSAVESRKTEGIYAALDNTFATLADNVVALANPETGMIETEGSEIVNMTYDVLQANFDNTPEELMGAIDAAALRAEYKGYIDTLGGDQQLMLIAAVEDEKKDAIKNTKKYLKSVFDGTLDGFGAAYPKFKAFVPILKLIGGNLFDLGGTTDNTSAEIIARIDELEAEVKNATNYLKDHTYNVVQLASLGDKYNTVADKADTIRTYIGDIELDISKTDEQKLQEIADLYKDSEFKSLVSAMNGATRCFTSRENDIFENQNVFEAAYARACEEVMFSKEAIDMTLPYLARQLNTYLAAYATMSRVFDAQVAVYGESAVLQSRKEMSLRLTGCDLNGTKVQKSMIELYEDYFSRDKFTFVGKSNNTNIRLKKEILYIVDFAENFTNDTMIDHNKSYRKAPDFMKKFPLSAKNMEDLTEYCQQKKTSLFQLLFNTVGFEPNVMTKRWSKKDGWHLETLDTQEVKTMIGDSMGLNWQMFPIGGWVVNTKGLKNMYIAAGPQNEFYYEEWDYHNMRIRIEAIKATGIPGDSEKLLLRSRRWRGTDPEGPTKGIFMMFFQPAESVQIFGSTPIFMDVV